MALALFALSVDLIWGYTGLMSLGQGVFFGAGVYAVGYSLMFQKACVDADMPLVQQANMPRFPLLSSLPDWVGYLVNIWLAISLAVIVPVLLATVFGYAAFQRRIKGVYFSLITQALLLAFFNAHRSTLPVHRRPGRHAVPAEIEAVRSRIQMVDQYYLTLGMLAVCFLVSLALIRSKFGKVLTAIRDSEYRVMALGYNTAMYKTFIFAYASGHRRHRGRTFTCSALRTAGPDVIKPAFSIEVLILVAVGGRGTLYGAIIGAVLVNFGKTFINDKFSRATGRSCSVFCSSWLRSSCPTGFSVGCVPYFGGGLLQGDKKSLATRFILKGVPMIMQPRTLTQRTESFLRSRTSPCPSVASRPSTS